MCICIQVHVHHIITDFMFCWYGLLMTVLSTVAGVNLLHLVSVVHQYASHLGMWCVRQMIMGPLYLTG